jgi:mono/diheme cytochrome c family protein
MAIHQPSFGRNVQRLTLVLLTALTMGCVPPGKPDPANRPIMPDQIVDFDQLFAVNCAGCHGEKGEFGPAPPLNNPLFVEIVPEEDLLTVIRDGRGGTPMPPFAQERGGTLTDEQIRVLVAGIKSRWKSQKPLPESLPEYAIANSSPGLNSHDTLKRGEQIFSNVCASCHGDNGKGTGGDLENAINVPAFLALISDQAVRRTIICGRQDLGMPNFAESDGRSDDFQPLSTDEIEALGALLANWRASGGKLAQTER